MKLERIERERARHLRQMKKLERERKYEFEQQHDKFESYE
jgi:hypothetical protein